MSLDDLKVRDEVLQVMFWMLGENIAHEVDAAYVARFLAISEDAISNALAVLGRERLVLRGAAPGRYRLSEEGMREGGRRFQDEFRDLTKQAHGECAPGCWCHTPEGEGKECPSVTKARVAAGG
jgi:hypothetical protein